MNKVLLFNPRAANSKPRIPNSILQVAASIDGIYDYIIVDGNLETTPFEKILDYFKNNEIGFFGCTVMPGPQLKQAITITKKIKELYPHVKTIWGGYFPANHSETVIQSGFVDVIINGMADKSFPKLLEAFDNKLPLHSIPNLIFGENNEIIKTKKDDIYDLNLLPTLPYKKLNEFYELKKYLGKTYLGTKTIAYHSSFGCPFTCSFCAVVPIYEARWKGKDALHIYKDIKYLKDTFGGNAIEFHDNNFFVSEKRVVEFSRLIEKEKMIWWGEGRIDTINKYKDDSLKQMREAGCKMIFFGAETGNDAILKKMDKGGTQTGEQILKFAGRIARFDIIPEYSFVLGTPASTEKEVDKQIDFDIAFIKKIKQVNPKTEIIIYLYSPVATEGSMMYKDVLKAGFSFPKKLEDWISPEWENFDLRKNPLTPWLKPYMIDKIKNFETILNGYFPTVSDIRLSSFKRKFIRMYSAPRYHLNIHSYPLGIKIFHKLWKYRQPELEGF